MMRHLSANLWLLALTLVICSILYPLALLGIGQTIFSSQANGSIVTDDKGKPIGSQLIAQSFSGDEYFQPRPSAVSYNAAATGGTNWGANNPALRRRVLAQLGTVLKYGPKGSRPGQPIGPDIEAWFQKDQLQGKPGIVAQWANRNPDLAQAWVKASELNGKYVEAWMKDHSMEVAQWFKGNPDMQEPTAEDLAVRFLEWYSQAHPGTWPLVEEVETDDPAKPAQKVKQLELKPAQAGNEIRSNFYPMWREEHAQADLAPVPADMVMASGSGLDPQITLKNALYQLDRVAAAWAEKTKTEPTRVHKDIEDLLRQKTEAPLRGLVGVDLVNVLELNVALRGKYAQKSE